ncbi:UDP-glycosyltransferase 13-like [Senna tora]|uniref:UDP-glycosyltransferase 13-like n=1 Tax=Senna tora TaxID=362788 RepID=A0A834WQD7_9FABA|nr:UDP-glycosyltransferase 13-like [Senna tora]
MRRDRVQEIREGLLKSEYRFLWVLKDKIVDKEEIEEVVGFELMEKLKKKGMVVETWVDQREVLGHGSVGGFVSHCGWNSVVEAVCSNTPPTAPHPQSLTAVCGAFSILHRPRCRLRYLHQSSPSLPVAIHRPPSSFSLCSVHKVLNHKGRSGT